MGSSAVFHVITSCVGLVFQRLPSSPSSEKATDPKTSIGDVHFYSESRA